MQWVSWHTHFTTSYGDGFGTAIQHAERAHALEMSALADSDHGNVSGHAAHEQACAEFGLKAHFGCEVYFGPTSEEKRGQAKTHLTIFAMNDQGYHNLNKIITQSYVESYYKPTVSWANLVKHKEGIVVFSGCSDSLLSSTLMGGKFLGPKLDPIELVQDRDRFETRLDRLADRAEMFRDIFEDRFFLEVQRFPQLARTRAINSSFALLSEKTGIPMIGTADVHYPYPHQNVMQTALHAAHRDGTVATIDAEWEYDILLTYPESDEEILDDLVNTGLTESQAMQAVLNTAELSEKCNVVLPKAKKLRFPKVSIDNAMLCGPKDATSGDLEKVRDAASFLYLMNEIKKGWKYRVAQRPDLKGKAKEYSRRISTEMKVIEEKGFCDYFLVISDLIIKAKEADEGVAPGRGSSAGSLVCYLLRITEIDPLHPLFDRMVFERFIDKTRSDLPDIDTDFNDEKRHNTPARARAMYGSENVGSVANHQKYRGVSAMNAMAKAHNIAKSVFDPIKDRITDRTETDERVDDSLLDVITAYAEDPEIAPLIERYADAIKLACWLEGNHIGQSVHAGGFVLSSDPIPEFCALYTVESGKDKRTTQVIPYDKRDAEYLGMLKADFLGSATMGMIDRCRSMINMSLDELYALIYLEYEKPNHGVMQTILDKVCADDVVGIMQFEGGTTRQVTREVQPANFDELAACTALSRPGPFYGDQTRNYIAVKNGEKDWERVHVEGFDRHVEWTFGQIVYQEQIMWILRDLAGFSIDRVLKVRKIVGKKLGEHQFAALWEEFRTGCASNGVSEESAARVWNGITTAAGYAFNTAHAYSYALIAWWAEYLKDLHAPQFFGSTLAKCGDGKKQIPRRTALLKDTKAHGRDIAIGPFDLSIIGDNWRVQDDVLYPGLIQTPGIAENTADKIVSWLEDWDERDTRELPTWEAMAPPSKKGGVDGVGPITIDKIKSMVNSDDPLGINRVDGQLRAFREQVANGEFDNTPLPGESEYYVSEEFPDDDYVAFVGFVQNVDYRDEVEGIRRKSGKTTEVILEEMAAGKHGGNPDKTKKAVLFSYDEFGEVALRISRWKLDGLSHIIDAIKTDHHIVVAWGKVYAGKDRSLQVRSLWFLDPD